MSTLYDLDQLEMNLPQMRESGIKVEISIDDAINMVREISKEEVEDAKETTRYNKNIEIKDINLRHNKLKSAELSVAQKDVTINRLKDERVEESKRDTLYMRFFEVVRRDVIVRGEVIDVIKFNNLLDESGIDN